MKSTRSKKLFDEILSASIKRHASDIHLKTGIVPVIRKHGKLRPLSSKAPPLSNKELTEMLDAIMSEEQRKQFDEQKQTDIAYVLDGKGRFRINAFRELGNPRLVIRYIPSRVPLLEELNLPTVINKIPTLERGLVLVTGATGSGKSTTLAAIVDHINRNRGAHIITVEDPIEYLIKDRKSIISQVEIGTDAMSFASALRAGLRQDPDVILVGEMRDRETIEMALTAAETGHLVLSTLHTSDAMETINRILSTFPPHQHGQLRNQLASVLKVVVSIRLASRKDGEGFIPAVEVMVNNPRISELIADERRTHEITEVIAESRQSWQMQTFDQALHDLLKSGKIEMSEALQLATNPENFALKQSGISSTNSNNTWKSLSQEQDTEMHAWHGVKDLEVETAVGPNGKTSEESDDGGKKGPANWLKKLAK